MRPVRHLPVCSSRASGRVAAGGLAFALLLMVGGCASASHQVRNERAQERRAEYWRRPPAERRDRAREAASLERSASASGVMLEPNVPRLRCFDGTLSITCTPNGAQRDCCIGQGGVYRDAWGNVVAY